MGGETRQQLRAERRRLEKERRRSQLVIQPLTEAKEKARAPIVSFGDMIGLLAIPLAAASMLIDNMWAIGSCLFLATFIACVSITLHDNFKIMYRFAACIVSAVVFLSLFFVLHFEYDKRELAKNEGVLVPSNLPRPQTTCHVGDDEFAIFAGSIVAFNSERPTVLLSIGGADIIKADMDENGRIHLSTLKLYDDQNEIIARITSDGLWVHPLMRRERPDYSTLVIYDRRDAEVLKIKFINSNTIAISGIFRYPNRPPVILSDRESQIGPLRLGSGCLGHSKVGIQFN